MNEIRLLPGNVTAHLGSLTLMTLPGGALHSDGTARYEPFGGFQQAPAANPGLNRHGYTGHRHNNQAAANDLGLIYMNARYYLPHISRFISADSIVPNPSSPQSLNRFSYARNRPMILRDPTGHRECGALNDCSDPLPHASDFQEALLRAWIYYEETFNLPYEGEQRLTQPFGPHHDGIDWGGDFTVLAPASGTVTQAGVDTPAGMWRIGHILRDDNGNRIRIDQVREWSVFDTATERPLHTYHRGEDGLLEPERLLATGEWEDLQPSWSHTQGTVIKIDHNHNLETIYYHTNYSVAGVTTVNQGDVLGVTVNNGWSSGTHLHYTLQFIYHDRPIKLNPLAPPPIIQHLLTVP